MCAHASASKLVTYDEVHLTMHVLHLIFNVILCLHACVCVCVHMCVHVCVHGHIVYLVCVALFHLSVELGNEASVCVLISLTLCLP